MAEPKDKEPTSADKLRHRLGKSVSTAPQSRIKSKPGSGTSADTHRGRSDYVAVKAALLARVLDDIGDRRLTAEDEEGVSAVVRQFVDRVLPRDVVLTVRDAMRQVVDLNNHPVRSERYQLFGKSGTAQLPNVRQGLSPGTPCCSGSPR